MHPRHVIECMYPRHLICTHDIHVPHGMLTYRVYMSWGTSIMSWGTILMSWMTCTHDIIVYVPTICQILPTISICTHDIKNVPHDINQTTVNSRMQRFTYNFSTNHVVGNFIDVVGNIIDVVDDMVPTISKCYPRHLNDTHDMVSKTSISCVHLIDVVGII